MISIHAPLAGCDSSRSVSVPALVRPFQSTHPLRGATPAEMQGEHNYIISIHAPLAGCDVNGRLHTQNSAKFQSTHPLRGATDGRILYVNKIKFQSTHPLRGATALTYDFETTYTISIHAPLAGCDDVDIDDLQDCVDISIHAPLAGCDSRNHAPPCAAAAFQSTHPLRGATVFAAQKIKADRISIHAPLAGCDSKSAQKNAALLRKRYKYKLFVCKKCTSGDLTGAYSSKNTLYSGANCSENPCALSVRTHRISGPSTSNPGLMPKCSILERYFSPR